MIISFLFVCCRIGIRLSSFGRLWFDDFFVFVGWSMVLATTITWHFAAHDMFETTAVVSGQISPADDPTYIPNAEHYLRSSIGVLVLFQTSLLAIKLSFLFFFRRLTTGLYIKVQMIQWWVIFGITVATWFASIGTIDYGCLAPSLLKIASHCTDQWSVNFSRITLIVNCAMDLTTDALSEYRVENDLATQLIIGIPSHDHPNCDPLEHQDQPAAEISFVRYIFLGNHYNDLRYCPYRCCQQQYSRGRCKLVISLECHRASNWYVFRLVCRGHI